MRKITVSLFGLAFLISTFFVVKNLVKKYISGAPPYGVALEEVPKFGVLSWLSDWERPEGPAKVALQVGHWKNEELPEELEKLRGNSGSSGGGKSEWEVNLAIAEETAERLRKEGVEVEILPATVPASYWADVFISIHADGSTDSSKRGFKIASPWRDYTRAADKLVQILQKSYQEATGWEKDPNITRNMRGYYAFSWWRYEHAIHPMTTAAIVETGFLTSATDRRVLIENPEIPAEALTNGILMYLKESGLIES